MAAINLYLIDSAVDGWQRLSETPAGSAATIVGGWVVSTGATNHSEFAQGVERAASTFTGTTVPDGSLDTGLHDAFRSENPYTGDFASADWVAHFVVRAVTVGGAQDGRVRFRLIKANADGSSPTEITSGHQQGSAVSNVSTSADFDSTLTFNPGAFSVSNQYLFLQVAWERTGAGGMTTSDINFRTGSSTTVGTRFVTSDFTPSFTGSGSPTASQAATADGTAVETFIGSGTPTASQAASADGTATNTPDEPDPITGSGSPTASQPALADGAARETFIGSGTPTASQVADATGVAKEIFRGSGTPTASQVADATGAARETFIGSGTPTASQTAEADGTATHIEDGAVIGSGSPVASLEVIAEGEATNTPDEEEEEPRRARGRIIFVDEKEETQPAEPKAPEIEVPEAVELSEVAPLVQLTEAEMMSPAKWESVVAKGLTVEQAAQHRRIKQQEKAQQQEEDDEEAFLQIVMHL